MNDKLNILRKKIEDKKAERKSNIEDLQKELEEKGAEVTQLHQALTEVGIITKRFEEILANKDLTVEQVREGVKQLTQLYSAGQTEIATAMQDLGKQLSAFDKKNALDKDTMMKVIVEQLGQVINKFLLPLNQQPDDISIKWTSFNRPQTIIEDYGDFKVTRELIYNSDKKLTRVKINKR